MADYVVRDTQLTSVADAIRAKGGTSDPMSFPDGFVSAVEAIPTGGGPVSVPAKEINFRDYDGTVVYAYTPAEFAALTAMPANPDHSGDEIPLTSQGWNWSLSDAQAYVAKYGRLEVGQMYATADGKTHVLIHLEPGRTSPILGVCPNGTVDVDWGDGTAHDTLTGTSVKTVEWTPTHEYAAPGDYDIKLTCSGTMGFVGTNQANQHSCLLRYVSGSDFRNRIYVFSIKKVYCSSSVTTIGQYAFFNCYGLKSITLPNTVAQIGDSSFNTCHGLKNIILPNSVESIGQASFSVCYSLNSIAIPNSITKFDSTMFQTANVLARITIPESVVRINNYVFNYCYSMSTITIPESVTNIGPYAFQNCYGLAEIHFHSTIPPTVSSYNAFSNLPTDCKIYVPAGSLSAYTTATNYPSASTYTYIEE